MNDVTQKNMRTLMCLKDTTDFFLLQLKIQTLVEIDIE